MADRIRRKKFLVETSCVPVALGESTKSHGAEFAKHSTDGDLHTSVYIRKEYIRGWIRTYISLCFQVEHFGNLSEALVHLEQSFGAREPKRLIHAMSLLFREKGNIQNVGEAATEFARLAIRRLKAFDRTFASRIPNHCGCSIGGKPLLIDFREMFDSLRCFLNSISDVADCAVNDYLKIENASGRAQRFVELDGVLSTPAGTNLAELVEKRERFGCRKCAAIGDAIIALEQPPSWHMLAHDRAFEKLCAARGRQVTIVPSERAVESDAPRI